MALNGLMEEKLANCSKTTDWMVDQFIDIKITIVDIRPCSAVALGVHLSDGFNDILIHI